MSERLILAGGVAVACHAGLLLIASVFGPELGSDIAGEARPADGQPWAQPAVVALVRINPSPIEFVKLAPSKLAPKPAPKLGEATKQLESGSRSAPQADSIRSGTKELAMKERAIANAAGPSGPGAETYAPRGESEGDQRDDQAPSTSLHMRQAPSLLDIAEQGALSQAPKTPASDAGGARDPFAGIRPQTGLIPERRRDRSLASSKWRADGKGGYAAQGEPFHAAVSADGSIDFVDKPTAEVHGLVRVPIGGVEIPLPILYGGFDATDMLMKAKGETLYSYRKHKLMEATREEREKIAQNYTSRVLLQSLGSFRSRLRYIMEQDNPDMAGKRRILFELWDECAQEGSEETLKIARAIRTIITDFVASELPLGSPKAYPKGELEHLNSRRQSAERFAPYR